MNEKMGGYPDGDGSADHGHLYDLASAFEKQSGSERVEVTDFGGSGPPGGQTTPKAIPPHITEALREPDATDYM